MKLIWTKSNLILSKMIRWGLDCDCSHFAVVLYADGPGEIMFESNLLGTHPKFYRNAQKHFELVHCIEIPLSQEMEDKLWDRIVDKYDDKDYDDGGFLYFAWRILLKKLFKIPLPPKNKWSSADKFLCDEIYMALVEEGIVPDLGLDLSITSPHEVYEKLAEHLGLV